MNYLLQRRRTLINNLKKDSIEAFLVTSSVNVTYLTGFTGEDSYYFASPKNNVLISDTRYEEQIKEECLGIDDRKDEEPGGQYPRSIRSNAGGKDEGLEAYIRSYNKTTLEAAAEVLTKSGVKSVGVEGNRLTLGELEALKTLAPKVTFVPVEGAIEGQRVLKDMGEVENIREAVRVAERAFRMFTATLREADTEKEMVDLLESYIRRAGGRSSAFPPIVAVGERGALPHAPPTTKQLGEGTKLLIDWGADMLYKSDLTRTIRSPFDISPSRRNKFERVGLDFEKVYDVVLQAQNAALAAIKPGVKAKDVDAAARQSMASAKLKGSDIKLVDHFTHGLGHGIGLEVHESPRIRSNSEDVLEAGMVVTIEPGVYIQGWGGIRIEDDVLITTSGATLLSNLPRELASLEE